MGLNKHEKLWVELRNEDMYKEVEGDLIEMALAGEFDVIAHGVNCQCVQGAGIAKQMVEAFGTDKFSMEDKHLVGEMGKLGNIDYELFFKEKEEYGGRWVKYPDEDDFITGDTLVVVNAYTQFNYGRNHSDGDEIPLDYNAFGVCMKKINHEFKGRHIGLPQIGAGLAGGDWERIKEIIKTELKDCKVTIVNYKK